MASEFLMQILHVPTGEVVRWAPGQPVEAQFIEDLVSRVRAKGVGVGRTADHVAMDVRTAVMELLFDLKKLV